MKMTCIIVDDEPLALDILEDHIRRTPTLELAGRFGASAEALKVLEGGAIDIAFLDIQMPGMNGLDVAKQTGAGTRVIFTTAFPQYAIEGFRVDALDYLLKPISFDEFTRSVRRAEEWFKMQKRASGNAPTGGKQSQNLIVKSDYKQFVIPVSSIVYIEGIRDYIRIHTTDAAGTVQTLMNMKTVEEMLPASHFVRVHRSYIVNLDAVKKIERNRIILGDVAIPISDTYKEAFSRALASRSL